MMDQNRDNLKEREYEEGHRDLMNSHTHTKNVSSRRKSSQKQKQKEGAEGCRAMKEFSRGDIISVLQSLSSVKSPAPE